MSRWVRARAAWTESADGVVVAGLTDVVPTPLVLQGTGAVIWLALPDGGSGADERDLATEFAREYGVAEEEVGNDLRGFLEHMQTVGLVLPVNATTGADS